MRVGLIGLGIMGQAMAERLLAAGHSLTVYNRTRQKADAVLSSGAEWAERPAALAAGCDVVITIVTDSEAVEAVSLGPEGLLAGLGPESVHADMSTVAPHASARLAAEYRRQGRRFVQAPVLGSRKQIQQGALLVFGGGVEEDVARAEEAWSAFASRNWRLPSAEQAATTKLACNMLLAHTILGLGQSLLFADKGGVDASLLLDILGASALASPMIASKGKTLVERNFEANFYVRHMLKDLRLAAEAGEASDCPLLLNGLTRQIFAAAVAQGFGDEDYSAAVKVLEGLNVPKSDY